MSLLKGFMTMEEATQGNVTDGLEVSSFTFDGWPIVAIRENSAEGTLDFVVETYEGAKRAYTGCVPTAEEGKTPAKVVLELHGSYAASSPISDEVWEQFLEPKRSVEGA